MSESTLNVLKWGVKRTGGERKKERRTLKEKVRERYVEREREILILRQYG